MEDYRGTSPIRKRPPPLGLPWGPRHSLFVGSSEGTVAYEQGTPVEEKWGFWGRGLEDSAPRACHLREQLEDWKERTCPHSQHAKLDMTLFRTHDRRTRHHPQHTHRMDTTLCRTHTSRTRPSAKHTWGRQDLVHNTRASSREGTRRRDHNQIDTTQSTTHEDGTRPSAEHPHRKDATPSSTRKRGHDSVQNTTERGGFRGRGLED